MDQDGDKVDVLEYPEPTPTQMEKLNRFDAPDVAEIVDLGDEGD